MGEIVRVLEGPISPMICATEGEMTQICSFLESCGTKYLWARVRDAVAQTLDSITLAELARKAGEPVQGTKQFIALSDIHIGPTLTGVYVPKDDQIRRIP
jgi:DNA-binding IscR family transcriptional regulator